MGFGWLKIGKILQEICVLFVGKYGLSERRLDVVEWVVISNALGMDPKRAIEAIQDDDLKL